ncbi:ras-associating and dilute domain-containing protein-like isoform X3 [Dunckerocampus dactyliophorus]|uniref:ras-associating and dilute domain-containing protein-like isoform X3 n=1 Tax=Dunckerocampus dactyliophorus TaxID=161453 RepID=UPI002406FDB9|nr:ras-associating and dilute domain-containing protein-like isoform X3 [Dunckerocampus dactyliophorus]
MISEERSSQVNKQAVVGLLIRSPKKRLVQLGRKASNGSAQSNSSVSTVRSTESTGVRQPAKSKIRRHNNRLSSVFNRSPNLRDGARRSPAPGHPGQEQLQAEDDPAELSCQVSVPGILKIFGSDICQGTNYKSVLATTQSSSKELVKEALDRYCLEKEDACDYVLCDVIGQTSGETKWRRECFRVVGDNEKPLVLQSLWKPKEGFSRRFEIQRRSSVEEQSLKERDTVTAGINAQARKLQKNRSRATSLFVDGSVEDVDGLDFWRSLSEMDLSSMGKEASADLREEQQTEADKVVARLDMEKEETESSDDNSTQYSIHPPFDFPYFLLLHGYCHRQDFIIYLMSGSSTVLGCCREHCNGDDEESLKVDILLFAPDVFPQHCCVKRMDSAGEPKKTVTVLKPLHGALVTRNGFVLKEESELHPGDLVGLGEHYLFMFKDPTSAAGRLETPPWMRRLCPSSDTHPSSTCQSCSSPPTINTHAFPPHCSDPQVLLSYELEQEEKVLQEIMNMLEPSGPAPKLTAAFLLSLCIQHSASTFQLSHFRQLLLRIAARIQHVVWDKTKELARMQTESAEGKLLLRTQELMSGLRPLALWMANSIELLYFIQHRVPQLMAWRRDQNQQGLRDEDVSCTRSACEEAMTVLEEVIMFTFQQSVYYLTKSMYSALPALLDGNPFSESGQLRVPDGLSSILDLLQEALQLFSSFQVHPDICLQLCAYLFFFINASLFNALMERGSVVGFYQWSRGVQMRANLDLLMDWVHSVNLGDVASDFFQKLSAAINLLATPKETLLQASWSSLRAEFCSLNTAQLQHMLTQYNTGKNRPNRWNPEPDHAEEAARTADILENFEQHPPLILPSRTFFLDPGGSSSRDPALLEQLARLRAVIGQHQEILSACSRTCQSPVRQDQDPPSQATPTETPVCHGDLISCQEVLIHKLKSLQLDSPKNHQKNLHLDPSCLLTPPNTPQGTQLEAELQQGAEEEEKEEEREDVFTVEIHRGPHGLGLALVDGTKTPLRMSGIYVKSLVPESPAALCERLKTGDRILAVNGVSLVGLEYSIGRELIRSSGDSLRLLVANMDANKNSHSTKC